MKLNNIINQQNIENLEDICFICKHSSDGFYVFTTHTSRMQETVANALTELGIAIWDYAENNEPYSYYKLAAWADENKDKKVFGILNVQLALKSENDTRNFNLSRDMLARNQKIWLFGMTTDEEKNISMRARDFYSYVRQIFAFEEEQTGEMHELLNLESGFSDFIPASDSKAMLRNYASFIEREKKLGFDESKTREENLSDAKIFDNIAKLYANTFEYKKSTLWYMKALKVRESVLGVQHHETAISYRNVGEICYERGLYDRAADYFEKSLKIFENEVNHQVSRIVEIYIALAKSNQKKLNLLQAIEYGEKALVLCEQDFDNKNERLSDWYNVLGSVYHEMKNYKKALDYFFKAVYFTELSYGKTSIEASVVYNNFALLNINLGKYKDAHKLYQKSLEIAEKVYGIMHPYTATIYNNIRGLYFIQGDKQKALDYALRCYEILLCTVEDNHPLRDSNKKNLYAVFLSLGYKTGFDEWLANELKKRKLELPQ